MMHWLTIQTPLDILLRPHCSAHRKAGPDLMLDNVQGLV